MAAYHAPVILLYIDPGAGSLAIQALIAAAVSAPFLFRNWLRTTWRRIRGVGPEPVEASTDQASDSASDHPKD